MRFIRLITGQVHHAFFNMALDEAICDAVLEQISPPTLRFYQWDCPSVSIGYFQPADDIDHEYCALKGYPVVRRQTGGRAIFHDDELTYSFSASHSHPLFAGSLIDNYTVISRALLKGLHLAGIEAAISLERKRDAAHRDPACFQSLSFGEITVRGSKVIGSAQKRCVNGFMQHGSIVLGSDRKEIANILKCTDAGESRRAGALKDHAPAISAGRLMSFFKSAFEAELDLKLIVDSPSAFELSLAGKLEKEKYSTREWNFRK